MKKTLVLSLVLLALCLCACSGTPASLSLDPAQYTDPPEAEWLYQLDIYRAWDGVNGESNSYTVSTEGIIEEGTREDPNNPGEDEFLEIPGGRTYFFRGVAPGDVQLTFTVTKDGKTMDQAVYAIRVFDDLRLVILDEKSESYRA
ncbi:MAG: hypothetical protein GXY32_06720 [Ruminococcaceae bacterium]|nr:hypothetical protein [Oscillospiraceae bacterium]